MEVEKKVERRGRPKKLRPEAKIDEIESLKSIEVENKKENPDNERTKTKETTDETLKPVSRAKGFRAEDFEVTEEDDESSSEDDDKYRKPPKKKRKVTKDKDSSSWFFYQEPFKTIGYASIVIFLSLARTHIHQLFVQRTQGVQNQITHPQNSQNLENRKEQNTLPINTMHPINQPPPNPRANGMKECSDFIK